MYSKYAFFVFALLGPLLCPADAGAFTEDLCVAPQGGTVMSCLAAPLCAADDTSQCPANLSWQPGSAPVKGRGRSMIHMDATYFIAQALGFRPDVAYWIAAYDEVADQGGYVPFDRCGRPVADPGYAAEPITGLARTSFNTGSVPWHFGVAYSTAGDGSDLEAARVTGVYPFYSQAQSAVVIEDVHEGAVAHLRRWAMVPDSGPSAPPVVCTDGLTQTAGSGTASPFSGSACYNPNVSMAKLIRGTVPLFSLKSAPYSFSAYSGPQFLLSDAGGVERFYDQLGAILAAGQGRMQDGTTVPAELGRIGLYLHVLQDRISHHYCGDASYLKYQAADKTYAYMYDADSCTDNMHARVHAEEVGQGALPLRTYMALSYTYDELKAFADAMQKTQKGRAWFTSRAPIAKGDLVGVARGGPEHPGVLHYVPGIVTTPLLLSDGAQRLQAMTGAIQSLRLYPLPGNGPEVKCQ